MKAIFGTLILIVFFVFYKWKGIDWAIISSIAIYAVQILVESIRARKIDKLSTTVLIITVILGSLTVFLDNELFFKWKVTVVNWVFAIALVVGNFWFKKPTFEVMLGKELEAPRKTWANFTRYWIYFFIGMGFLNLWVAYQFDTDTWVNFKLFGTLILSLIFTVANGFYLMRNGAIKQEEEKTKT